MDNFFKMIWMILLTLLILLNTTCKKEGEPKIIKSKISGQVQKGPYINGTFISMSELNSSLSQTGNIFTTQITNNKGSFEIDNISLTSSYVEFNANGYYFDEVKGDLSASPLNLTALSDIKDISTVNVNILTHLEKQRVTYLIKQNKSFSEAKKTAQGEILSMFGFSINGISSSESLDITVNSEGNAILLAISVILQGKRSVGDLTELLANISNDIKEDGKVTNATITSNLRNSTKQLSLTNIRSNLEKRLQELEILATIPQFEKYINDFLAFTGKIPEAETKMPTNVSPTNAILNGTVNPNSLNTTVMFQWGITNTYSDSIGLEQNPISGSYAIDVSRTITGLLPATRYHFRLKARNLLGTSYGGEMNFTTLPVSEPSITTTVITNISHTTATGGGNVTSDGGSPIIERGIIIGPSPQSSIADNKLVSQGTLGLYEINFVGLSANKLYYVKAFATNAKGTTYGEQKGFRTLQFASAPSLTTTPLINIGRNSAEIGGNIINDGGGAIIERGICYSSSENPTISDNKITKTGTLGSFTCNLTGLADNTTYYFRAYATNSGGTAYGEQMTFRTFNSQVLRDIDGNNYYTVTIGTQVWLAENLKTSKFNDGTPVALVIDTASWRGLSTPGYCWFDNDEAKNKEIYGALYNWFSVDPVTNGGKNLCPVGWQVPTYVQWETLLTFLGGADTAGGKLKETGTTHWIYPNTGATNEVSFSALPAGYRLINGSFMFGIGSTTHFWTQPSGNWLDSWDMNLGSWMINVGKGIYDKRNGFSIRCIKD